MNRRDFFKFSGAAVASTISKMPAARAPVAVQNQIIALFTDFVDDAGYGFDYQDVASLIRQVGVTGPDLTVRPGGLVAPGRVAEELPKAAAVFREHDLSIPLISTGFTSIKDPVALPTLRAAAQAGVAYYRSGYYSYQDPSRWRYELESARRELQGIVETGRQLGIQGIFHNHSGPTIGGAMWDLWELLEPLDRKWIGCSFDPSHATIEGGKNGWVLGFYRLAPRIKVVSVKDFYWEKAGGRWRTRWCPLGEGTVDWPRFFKMLAALDFQGPISVGIEYDPGGNTRAARFENSLAAAERDVKFIREQIRGAFD